MKLAAWARSVDMHPTTARNKAARGELISHGVEAYQPQEGADWWVRIIN